MDQGAAVLKTLRELLDEQGIADPLDYLESSDRDAILGYSGFQDVAPTGSVHLMLRRMVRRAEVDERLAKLKHV